MKKVSIVVPVYNMDKSLSLSVSDLLVQTYPNLEIILIDDGSTDNTLQVCYEIAQNDERVKVVHTENQGCGRARDVGIQNATGDYLYSMDADDHIEPETIEVLVNTMEREQCDLVIFGHRTIDTKGREAFLKTYPNMTVAGSEIRENFGNRRMGAVYDIPRGIWDKFFDLTKIKENNIMHSAIRRHEAEIFVIRYISVCETVSFIDKVFYTYYNDFKNLWRKFPINYMDLITESMQERMKTIAGWNPDNKVALELIRREFIGRMIRVMEFTFNKSTKLSKQQQLSWLRDVVERAEVQEACAACRLESKYLKIICSLIRAKRVNALCHILHLKALALSR